MKTKTTFEQFLRKENLSENSVSSYIWTVEYFNSHYDGLNKENLLAYKGYLMETYKPKTVNLRIQAINKYLEYMQKDKLQLKLIKLQQKNFIENVISNADYKFLKNHSKKAVFSQFFAIFVCFFAYKPKTTRHNYICKNKMKGLVTSST